MDNSINYTKLDEIVKKALSTYETSYNQADWAQMEIMLDVAPKQISLRKSNSPILLVILATIGGAFLLYMLLKPTETIDTSTQIYLKKAPKIKKTKPFIIHRPATIIKDTTSVKKELKPITTTSKINTPTEQASPTAVRSNKNEVKTESKKVEKTDEEIKKERAAKKEEQLKREKKSKKEAQLKKGKAAKKEVKKEPETEEENEVIPLEEENDSNRNKLLSKPAIDSASSVKTQDSTKADKEKKSSKKETKRSKRDKKVNTSDPSGENKSPSENVSPDGINKNSENNKKDTIK